MLQILLNETEARARRVVDIAAATGHAVSADHARQVAEQVVPLGRKRREEVLGFVDAAQGRIEQAARQNSVESVRLEFQRILDDLLPLATALASFQAQADAARAAIQDDLAGVNREVAELGVRVAARAQEAAEAQAKAQNRADRSFWTWFGGPLVKAIDELVSLFQDGTSTEEGARQALEALQQAQADIARCQNAQHTLQILSGGAGDLSALAQSLVNAIAIVG
ncbi:MAG TPA: hypothetical protein VI381_04070, partial [Allosphingosinicella sp.]